MTLDSIVDKALSRRSFLTGAGAVATSTLVAGCSTDANTTPSGYTDADVLNFALNLEYLEAEFYLRAATGSGLAPADITPGSASPYQTVGTVTAGNAALVPGLTTPQQQILNEIAFEEQAHVRFLRKELQTVAVPRPSIDLSFFGPLATTAGIVLPNSATFNPFASFDAFLVGAFIFEDVGVSAYAGAATLFTPAGITGGFLTAASGILAVEAYHAAYIRTSLTGRAISAGSAAAYPYLGYANQIEALRQTLTVGGNSVETSMTLPITQPAPIYATPSGIVAADPVNAIGFARNVNQIHHIVYGSGAVGAASGGFFPSGTNSYFSKTTA